MNECLMTPQHICKDVLSLSLNKYYKYMYIIAKTEIEHCIFCGKAYFVTY